MYCNTHNHTVGLFFCVFFFSPRILLLLPIDNISLYGKQHTFFLLKHTLTYTLGAVAGMRAEGTAPDYNFYNMREMINNISAISFFLSFFFPLLL